MLYARAITLRNCGRFTVVASDFGSDYRTHTHVTSEALHASLTRGATWQPRLIDLKDDPNSFTLAYDVAKMPIWFLPGIFLAEGSYRLPDGNLDTTSFNVVHELYPSTSSGYIIRKGGLEERRRPSHVPTYGSIQAIKPDRRVETCGFSPSRELLEGFAEGQTFFLGKKRAMVQIVKLSGIGEGQRKEGTVATPFLQIAADDIQRFTSFVIAAATMRYLVVRGEVRGSVPFWRFEVDAPICLPEWYLQQSPLGPLAAW